MNDESFIFFIDSGLGGISILNNFLDKKKDQNIIYYADAKNFPYGKKEEAVIGNILIDAYSSTLQKYKISMIVIACNTASVSAIKYLREKVNIPVIGTVPAVKPANQVTKNNKIGIIATETAAKGKYLSELVEKFASGKNVFIKGCQKLVAAAENMSSGDELLKIIDAELTDLKKEKIDTLVLGCTHYVFLKEAIEEYFEGKVKVLDSTEGVTKRILELLQPEKVSNGSKRILIVSGNDKSASERYKKLNNKYKIFTEILTGDFICQKV